MSDLLVDFKKTEKAKHTRVMKKSWVEQLGLYPGEYIF